MVVMPVVGSVVVLVVVVVVVVFNVFSALSFPLLLRLWLLVPPV